MAAHGRSDMHAAATCMHTCAHNEGDSGCVSLWVYSMECAVCVNKCCSSVSESEGVCVCLKQSLCQKQSLFRYKHTNVVDGRLRLIRQDPAPAAKKIRLIRIS